MRRSLVLVALAVLLTGGAVAAGTLTLGEDDDGADTTAPYRTTPLAELDAGSVSVTRGPFCAEIDPRLVRAVLGAEPASDRAWDSGDPVPLGPRREDVGHEYGCEYVADDGSAARAWVYAPPVDAAQAARLAKRFRPSLPGSGWCTGAEPATFGTPSASVSCLAEAGPMAAYGGLFGDAWLHCELVVAQDEAEPPGDPGEIEDRAGRWCVGVAEAADASDA